ncbi:MAG: hypothetical protein GC161_15600 [Planctomycetaceae bacterium]|nr:hypothetical protein [Planctomycetaceae bacterium]
MSPTKWSLVLPLVAAVWLPGCLSSSQFAGTYAEGVQTQTFEFDGAVLLVESYQEISYNFWGETFEGVRYDYTLTSRSASPLLGKVVLEPAGGQPVRAMRHDEEHTIQPGASAYVGTVLFEPSVRSAEVNHQAFVRPVP